MDNFEYSNDGEVYRTTEKVKELERRVAELERLVQELLEANGSNP